VRVLLTFVGGAGHLDPLLPLARALAAAGHDVAIAGSGNQMPRAEAAGFTALPTSAQRPPAASSRDLTPLPPVDPHDTEVEFAENFGGLGARRHVPAVSEHIRTWRPDVILREETDFGSAIAAELEGVPCATLVILAAGTLARPELVSPVLQAVRAEHGLAPDPDLASFRRDLVLSPFPPGFRDPVSPLPAGTFSFRPQPVTSQAHGGLVYVTLGTVFNTGSGDLFERLLAGLAGVPAKVLVTVGRGVEPDELGTQPAHIRVEQYVDQAGVLPRCALVVSHGGSGSLMGALAHGIPSVLTPLGADQPHNARRAAELGVAAVLDAASVTPDDVERAVTTMLADTEARATARALKAEIDALPSVEATVPRLERLAGH
jgi:UDP:flavonoid glycosyltransferase YjiC (YdhE family)